MSLQLRIGLIACACIAACSQVESPTENAAAAESGWITLFDGSNLNGWTPVGDANWQLADGTVRADAGNGFLVTNGFYTDFDLEFEFWVTADANSGAFIRCANPTEIGAATCYEVNIFDQRPDPKYRTGAIVDVAEPKVKIDTGGRWNSYAISARGQRLVITLNGQQTVDVQDSKLPSGPIALQRGAGTVMFRNVRIRE